MYSLLLPAALAASAREEVASAIQTWPGAGLVVGCSPMRAVMKAAGSVPVPPTASRHLRGEERTFLTLLDPEAGADAGIDPDGGIVLVFGEKELRALSLPFEGSREQADALVHRLFDDVEVSGDVWRVDMDGEPMVVSRVEGSIEVRSAASTVAPAAPARSPLVDGLPDSAGCVAWASIEGGGPLAEKLPGGAGSLPRALAAFLPLGGRAPFTLHVQPRETAAPVTLAQGTGGWASPRSIERPSFVASLSVPFDTILDLFAQDPEFPAAQLQQVRDVVSFPAGATLAVFGQPREQDFVGSVPVTEPDGSPFPAKKLNKLAVKLLGAEGRRTGPTTFEAKLKERPLYGHSRDGFLVLGTNAGAVASAAEGSGEPWLAEEALAYATRWPLMVEAVSSEAMPLAFRGGVRTRDGMWEVVAEMSPLPAELSSMFGAMITAAAVPAFIDARHKAQRAEAHQNVDAIRTALLAYKAEHDVFLALPAAPRPVEALDSAQARWTADTAWGKLGWEPEGPLYGTYWVELTGDGEGFTVHGATDIDGDGAPAEFTATTDRAAELQTGDKVY